MDKRYPKRPYDLSAEEAREPGKLGQTLREWGVAVVKDVFAADECREKTRRLVQAMEALSQGRFDHRDFRGTWNPEVLPPMVRSGLIQALMGNGQEVGELRSDDRVTELTKLAYSDLHGYEVKEVVCSVDGINIRPPIAPFSDDDRQEDWPHIDVSHKGRMLECIQAQIVLTNTTAAFRCSPKSHLVSDALMTPEFGGREQDGDWTRLQKAFASKFAEMVVAVGGKYQVPIHTSAGSMIFWLSSTVHSAITQRRGNREVSPAAAADPLHNWRCVVYVCHMPRALVTDADIWRRHWAAEHNRTTNHNGRRVFPLIPPTQAGVAFEPGMMRLIQDPKAAFELVPPCRTEKWMALLGVPSAPRPPGWTPFLPETRGRSNDRGRGRGRGRGRDRDRDRDLDRGSGAARGGGGGGSGAARV
jgi:hypothetical protein